MTDKKLGDTIRSAREDAGLSQQELADRLDVAKARISEWERGVHAPSVNALMSIAQALELNASDLIKKVEGDNNMTKEINTHGLTMHGLEEASSYTGACIQNGHAVMIGYDINTGDVIPSAYNHIFDEIRYPDGSDVINVAWGKGLILSPQQIADIIKQEYDLEMTYRSDATDKEKAFEETVKEWEARQ